MTLRSRPIYRDPFDIERFVDALAELALWLVEQENAKAAEEPEKELEA